MPDSPAVVLQDVVKRYDGRAVVDHLSLTASRGAVTAVLGPNGAGKTTTIECCEGLRAPDAGTVRVLGLDPLLSARDLRPRVGVMLQDGGLPTGVRALEMLHHVASMYVRRLSGGQRQRLALAAAIVGRPEVVVLDEPSAGMDPQSRHAVWELVRELRADGVGIVLTTHLMDEAEDLADHVYIVDHGQVIASGATPDLLHSGPSADGNRTLRLEARAGLDVEALAERVGSGPTTSPASAWTVTETQPGSYSVTGPVDPSTVAVVTAWLADESALASRITIGRRTLEDVFLDLTGRELR